MVVAVPFDPTVGPVVVGLEVAVERVEPAEEAAEETSVVTATELEASVAAGADGVAEEPVALRDKVTPASAQS